MKKMVPHLWFDKEAIEAAEFYTSLFAESSIESIVQIHDIPSGDSDSVALKLCGQDFKFISAGPYFKLSPAISLMVNCETKEEVERLWEVLSVKGSVLMDLKDYPFSPLYGWLNDRYGVSWQLGYWNEPFEQKIVPSLMYTGKQAGKAEEAIHFYTSLFNNSKVDQLSYYDAQETLGHIGMLQYGSFVLEGQYFAAMDSADPHDFYFTESFSIMVNCDTQEEIDFFWEKMSANPEAEQCGWLKDRYGVSWQIIPTVLDEMLATNDEEQRDRVTQTFLKMKKMNIAELEIAYEGK